MTINQIKQILGEQTQNLENKLSQAWNEFSPHYTNLEPYQRGLVLIGLLALLAFAIYYLNHESQNQKTKRKIQAEQAQEEKIIRRMELLKKLRE
jgi:hypothetical protein